MNMVGHALLMNGERVYHIHPSYTGLYTLHKCGDIAK